MKNNHIPAKKLQAIVANCLHYVNADDILLHSLYSCIAPAEKQLWAYDKGLHGDDTLNHIPYSCFDEAKKKEAAAVKPRELPLDDDTLFMQLSALWIACKVTDSEASPVEDFLFVLDGVLRALLSHRVGKTLAYGEFTAQLLFDTLEALHGETGDYYRQHVRILFLFERYRTSDGGMAQFYTQLNNLILNAGYTAAYTHHVGAKADIDATKLLPCALTAEEARDLLRLSNVDPATMEEAK